jgi:hypothetical protein
LISKREKKRKTARKKKEMPASATTTTMDMKVTVLTLYFAKEGTRFAMKHGEAATKENPLFIITVRNPESSNKTLFKVMRRVGTNVSENSERMVLSDDSFVYVSRREIRPTRVDSPDHIIIGATSWIRVDALTVGDVITDVNGHVGVVLELDAVTYQKTKPNDDDNRSWIVTGNLLILGSSMLAAKFAFPADGYRMWYGRSESIGVEALVESAINAKCLANREEAARNELNRSNLHERFERLQSMLASQLASHGRGGGGGGGSSSTFHYPSMATASFCPSFSPSASSYLRMAGAAAARMSFPTMEEVD